MEVTIKIPDQIATRIKSQWNGDLSRKCLGALAAEAYRSEVLTRGQIQQMLDFDSLYEVDGFLKKQEAYLHYNEEDFEQDLRIMQELKKSDQRTY